MIRTLAQVEREAIEQAMAATGGHAVKAAVLLGIGKTTIYRKLRQYSGGGDGKLGRPALATVRGGGGRALAGLATPSELPVVQA